MEAIPRLWILSGWERELPAQSPSTYHSPFPISPPDLQIAQAPEPMGVNPSPLARSHHLHPLAHQIPSRGRQHHHQSGQRFRVVYLTALDLESFGFVISLTTYQYPFSVRGAPTARHSGPNRLRVMKTPVYRTPRPRSGFNQPTLRHPRPGIRTQKLVLTRMRQCQCSSSFRSCIRSTSTKPRSAKSTTSIPLGRAWAVAISTRLYTSKATRVLLWDRCLPYGHHIDTRIVQPQVLSVNRLPGVDWSAGWVSKRRGIHL